MRQVDTPKLCRIVAASVMMFCVTVPERAAALDCKFFEDQAHYKEEIDYSVRMLEACRALAAYRARLMAENVRYAYGDEAVREDEELNAQRNEPLDTFHVLTDMQKYGIAHDTGVFSVINEFPPRRGSRSSRLQKTLPSGKGVRLRNEPSR